MKKFIDKKKLKVQNEGNSQFTRSKLESEYNPKYRISKHQLMSFQKIPLKDRHEYKSKEEHEICEKAVEEIKQGSNLVIDWNTKSIFRVTKSILPRLKTEPAEYDRISPMFQSQSSSHITPIEKKRLELAKLLHIRHKKHYLQTKRQQEQQKILFGGMGSGNHTSNQVIFHHQTHRRNNQKILFSGKRRNKTEQQLEKVQSQIINDSKLKILKEELKSKFVEIRSLLHKNESNSKQKTKGFFD